MLAKNKGPLFYWAKIYYFKYLGSLLVILLGIFLWPKTAYLSSITPEKIIELTNKERMENDLNVLNANQILAQAAAEKSQAILESNQFQHNIGGRKFSDWVRETGYEYSYVGENLAIDFITSEGVLDAWLASPTHKKNILNSYYQEIGVAVSQGNFDGQNTTLVVQIFGTPPLGVAQPRVAGEELGNYFTDYNISSPFSLPSSLNSLPREKFLTHSVSNELTFSSSFLKADNYYKTDYSENTVQSQLNNFFIQYNLLGLIKYLNLTGSILLLFFLSYIYFSCFSNLSRLT
ncbi:MAG: CAP domain-containing protein [Patescibacteria group bacterium]|nr:CAP domain-containing protein [Patescibacteria group bacterium]